jgi:uncharacterized protein
VIYEWNLAKAAQNERKHGVSFDEAITVFLDPLAVTFDDPDHSTGGRRFVTIGASTSQRLLFVAHGYRRGSARATTRHETYAYQERDPKRR